MDQLSYYITIHELAKVDASHALTISAHTNLGTSPIVEFGTAEQQRRYVPLLASGTVLGGFGLTEPGAGSDAGGTATTAVDKGDHYLLNGAKVFITHAGVGEIFVATARTEPGKGNKGITSFILTKETCDLDQCRALGVGRGRLEPAELAEHQCGEAGREHGLALGCLPQSGAQLVRGRGLHEVAHRSRSDRVEQVALGLGHREDHDRHVAAARLHHRDAAAGHVQVAHDQVGLLAADDLDRGGRVTCLADHGEVLAEVGAQA